VSRVYACDLDGTLLGRGAQLSDRSRAGLVSLLEAGIHVTIATARSVRSVQPMLEGLPFRLPVVEMNGAYVSDLATGEHHVVHAMPESVGAAVLQAVVDRSLHPFLTTFDGTRDRFYYSEEMSEGASLYLGDRIKAGDPRRTHTDDLWVALQDQVVCATIIDRREPVERLRHVIDETLGDAVRTHCFDDMYNAGWTWLTVYAAEAAKELALAHVLSDQGLDGHELVVFGDTDSDIGMFRMADRAVAVSNATDNLKAHATHHVGHHEDDAVIEFILADAAG